MRLVMLVLGRVRVNIHTSSKLVSFIKETGVTHKIEKDVMMPKWSLASWQPVVNGVICNPYNINGLIDTWVSLGLFHPYFSGRI